MGGPSVSSIPCISTCPPNTMWKKERNQMRKEMKEMIISLGARSK
jgi:hypothetical protein